MDIYQVVAKSPNTGNKIVLGTYISKELAELDLIRFRAYNQQIMHDISIEEYTTVSEQIGGPIDW